MDGEDLQSDGIRRFYYTGYIFQDVEFLVLDGSDGGNAFTKVAVPSIKIQRLKTSVLQIRNYASPQTFCFLFFSCFFIFSSFFFYLVFFSWRLSLGLYIFLIF